MGSSAQKNGFQWGNTPLVSTSNNHLQPSAIPPPEVGAVGILKDENDGDIFAWLKLARSLGPRGLHPLSTVACLTLDQVRAIGVLRHCHTNDIIAWLHQARTSTLGVPAVSASRRDYDGTPSQRYTEPSIPSDASIPGPLDHASNVSTYSQAPALGHSEQRCPAITTTPSQANPKYCCTLCDNERLFKNRSEWRKHEKEHDTTYVCMLTGPHEATLQEMQGLFYVTLNSPEGHSSAHNLQTCVRECPDSFSTKRRHKLVSHLSEKHHVDKSQGEAMAAIWKHTVEKLAWSCGFCVTSFDNFNDRLSHIVTHFEHGQTIHQWDATKVMQGLLQHPSMAKAWADKMASLPTGEAEDIIWERAAIKDLQHDLEVGPNDEKSAMYLAEAAYTACRYNWGLKDQRNMSTVDATSVETFISTPGTLNQSQASLASAPEIDSDHYESLSAVQEFNSGFPGALPTQNVRHDYSSASMANWNDTNQPGVAPTSFHHQQTHASTAFQDDENEVPGDSEDHMDQNKQWPSMPGSINEMEFDPGHDWDDFSA